MNYYSQFIIKSAKIKDGLAPVYLKITVDGKASEVSINKSVSLKLWENYQGRSKRGNSDELEQLRSYLKAQELKLNRIYLDLIPITDNLTSKILQYNFKGKQNTDRTIKKALDIQIKTIKARVKAEEIEESRVYKFENMGKHLSSFLQEERKCNDLGIGQIDYRFIVEFQTFLKEKGLHVNTVNKNLQLFKSTLSEALSIWDIPVNPTSKMKKFKWKKPKKRSLTEAEFQKLRVIELTDENDRRHRDMFILQCIVGLSYIDMKNLTSFHIVKDDQGRKGLLVERQKTDVDSKPKLTLEADAIISRYKNDPRSKGKLLPVGELGDYNDHLKVIFAKCFPESSKKISSHWARHTCIQRLRNAGMPDESIAAWVGHSNTREIKTYSIMTSDRVNNDYDKFIKTA